MKDSLPSQVLNEKLPRFLQKCAQTFDSDRRYKNDLRYLRVWLLLVFYYSIAFSFFLFFVFFLMISILGRWVS